MVSLRYWYVRYLFAMAVVVLIFILIRQELKGSDPTEFTIIEASGESLMGGSLPLHEAVYNSDGDELKNAEIGPTCVCPKLEAAEPSQNEPSGGRAIIDEAVVLPTIYMITPTYRRAEQLPEITRTAQTLLHVKNFVWIVVEDSPKPTEIIVDYLKNSGLQHVYLRAEMPAKFHKVKNKPRGVANRNAGLQWVRNNAVDGVVYFGDDDNTYDLRIFEEMRYTNKVSMFPVGLVTKLGVSAPIVKSGRVIGFYDGWIAKRKFPVDMASFAISVDLLKKHSNASMPFVVGYEEDGILKSLGITYGEIEPKADLCTKIWVWHTQTKKNDKVQDSKPGKDLVNTNIPSLREQLWRGV